MENDLSLLFVLCATYICGSQRTDTVILSPQFAEADEYTDVTLTCSYDGPFTDFGMGYFKWFLSTYETTVSNTNCYIPPPWLNNRNMYTYRCINYTSHSVTMVNITQQRHGETWRCGAGIEERLFISNNVTILVTVPVKAVTISPLTNILTKENEALDLQCISSPCRPTPKFRWYLSNGDKPAIILSESVPTESPSGAIQSYTNRQNIAVNRTWNERSFFCGAQARDEGFLLSPKIFLNVTYPPDGPPLIERFENGSEIKVLKDGFVNLKCSITGGNPLPRLEWNKNNHMPQIVSGSTVTKNITWQAIDKTKDELRCEAIQSALKYTTILLVNVLYPPDEPVMKVKSAFKEYTAVDGTLSVKEGQSFTLSCSADGNPPVSSFKWNDLPPSSNPVIHIANVTRKEKTVTCIVSNVMQINYPNISLIGSNKTSLTLDVLYPPTMRNFINITVVEEDDLSYSCDFVNGNPGVTEITWTGMNQTWSGQQLQLKNVSKQQEGLYKCTVHNFMSSWDGIQVVENVSGEFYLSVQVYGNDASSAPSSNSIVVAACVAGTVVGVVIVVAVIIIMVYRKRKSLSYQKKESSIQYYNVSDYKVAELNISTQVENANSYEAFQSTGSDQQYDILSQDDCKEKNDSDCNFSANNRSLNVYEGLRNTGFDQQYDLISPKASNVETGQHMVYENLQLTRNSEKCEDAN